MEHGKKIVLIESRVFEQIKDKVTFEHEKYLEKKHFRPAENTLTSANNLEPEGILNDNTISDDHKMKMYSTHWLDIWVRLKAVKCPGFFQFSEHFF